MNESEICPTCGKPIPTNAPMGVCPNCLIAVTGDTEIAGRFDPPTPDELAEKFPQLEILDLIGRGGMGAVYKVRQRDLDRVVALKILPPGIGEDPAFAERFSREARALAKLNHPNIVTLYEFGEADGLYFFLMEFVDGVNLREALNAGRFTPEEALAIVPPICEALQFAHDAGVVHRDIKPENLLLDKDGKIKIADFGVARMMGNQDEVVSAAAGDGEATTLPAGTPRYMAPEQSDDPALVDHRADIYALGVVLYELLTGEPPKGAISAPSKTVEVDVRIDEIVLRALEAKPELRFASIAEMQTEIETVVSTPLAESKPVSTRPAGRIWLWSLGCAVAIGALGFGLALFPDLLSNELGVSGDPLNWIALILFVLLAIPVALTTWKIVQDRRGPRSFVWSLLPAILVLALLALSLPVIGELQAPKRVGSRLFYHSPEDRYVVAAQTMHIDLLIGGRDEYFLSFSVRDNDGGSVFRQIDFTKFNFPDLPESATPGSYDFSRHGDVVWGNDRTVSFKLRGRQLLKFNLSELEEDRGGRPTEFAISSRANGFIRELSQNRFQFARTRLSPSARNQTRFCDTKTWWTTIQAHLGELSHVEPAEVKKVSDLTQVALVPVEFERGSIRIRVAFDHMARIDGFSAPDFKPLELGPRQRFNLDSSVLKDGVYLGIKNGSTTVGDPHPEADFRIGEDELIELLKTDFFLTEWPTLQVDENKVIDQLLGARWSANTPEKQNVIAGEGFSVLMFRTRNGDRGILEIKFDRRSGGAVVSYRILVPDATPESQIAVARRFSRPFTVDLVADSSYESCLIDFDSAELSQIPDEVRDSFHPDEKNEANWPGDGNLASYMRAVGADAALRWGEQLDLVQLGGITGILSEGAAGQIDNVKLQQLLSWKRKADDWASSQDRESRLTWTFQPNAVNAFVTRDGGLGVLEIISRDEERLRVRFRLVEVVD